MIPIVTRGVMIMLIGAMTFLGTMNIHKTNTSEIVINNRDSFIVDGEWVHMYDNALFQELQKEIGNQISHNKYKGSHHFEPEDFNEFEFDVRYRSDGTGWFDIDFRDNWSDDFIEGTVEKEINEYPKEFLKKLMKYKDN